MSSKFMETAIQDDWNNRDYIEKVSLNILKLAEFLNKFETSTRSQLSVLNEKLSQLERKMEYVEAATASVDAQPGSAYARSQQQ